MRPGCRGFAAFAGPCGDCPACTPDRYPEDPPAWDEDRPRDDDRDDGREE